VFRIALANYGYVYHPPVETQAEDLEGDKRVLENRHIYYRNSLTYDLRQFKAAFSDRAAGSGKAGFYMCLRPAYAA
jgi:hypothetical protein